MVTKATMVRECRACGQKNRVPPKHLADRGRCGRCHERLQPVSEPLDVGTSEFREIVAEAKVPILVDFWAEWCGPCRAAAPQVKRVASDMTGKALVLKVNTETHPDLAAQFRVSGIPNFVVLNRGKIVRQQPGLVDSREMRRWLEDAAQLRV